MTSKEHLQSIVDCMTGKNSAVALANLPRFLEILETYEGEEEETRDKKIIILNAFRTVSRVIDILEKGVK